MDLGSRPVTERGGIPQRVAQALRRWLPPGFWEGPPDRPSVALTFDDGPHPVLTPRILEVLGRREAPATFFTIGRRAERYPELTRRMHAEGHDVGNHTWSHRPLCAGAVRSLDRELECTEELLAKLAPGSPRIFRAPFGWIGPGGGAALRRARLLPIYWSVVPADWDPTPAAAVAGRVLRAVHPGAVVVLHAGQPWHAGTAAALETLILGLREQGYTLVTVRRMLEHSGWTVGLR